MLSVTLKSNYSISVIILLLWSNVLHKYHLDKEKGTFNIFSGYWSINKIDLDLTNSKVIKQSSLLHRVHKPETPLSWDFVKYVEKCRDNSREGWEKWQMSMGKWNEGSEDF